MDLREHYRQAVQADTRGAHNALVDLVSQRPFLNARIVEDHLNVIRPSTLRVLRQLPELNVLDAAPDGPAANSAGAPPNRWRYSPTNTIRPIRRPHIRGPTRSMHLPHQTQDDSIAAITAVLWRYC